MEEAEAYGERAAAELNIYREIQDALRFASVRRSRCWRGSSSIIATPAWNYSFACGEIQVNGGLRRSIVRDRACSHNVNEASHIRLATGGGPVALALQDCRSVAHFGEEPASGFQAADGGGI